MEVIQWHWQSKYLIIDTKIPDPSYPLRLSPMSISRDEPLRIVLETLSLPMFAASFFFPNNRQDMKKGGVDTEPIEEAREK